MPQVLEQSLFLLVSGMELLEVCGTVRDLTPKKMRKRGFSFFFETSMRAIRELWREDGMKITNFPV